MQIVYAITCYIEGPTKIGIASSLQRRLEGLQNGSWQSLRVGYAGAFYKPTARGAALGLGECFASSGPAARALEVASHQKLKALGLHIRGEWFDIDAKDAGLLIEKMADHLGLRPMVDDDFKKYIQLYGPTANGNRSQYRELKALLSSLEYGDQEMRRFLTDYKEAA